MTAKPPFALRLALVLGAAVLAAVPTAAAAQTLDRAKSIQVSLWPEYDRSDVLVIYRVTLPDSTPLPAQVRLLIPPDAPELAAAAYRDASGQLVNAASTRTDGATADEIQVSADGTVLQIEYYLPLSKANEERQFSFTWPGGLAADDFAFEVQEPVGATAMTVDPAPTSRSTDPAGLTYQLVDLGAQPSDAHPEVSFTYTKSSPALSAEALAPSVGLATPESTAGTRLDARSLLPWILLVAGIALIVGGVVYFLRGREQDRPPRLRHRSAPQAEAKDDRVDASPVYCHNCGTQATASDRFCRQCGTPLRV